MSVGFDTKDNWDGLISDSLPVFLISKNPCEVLLLIASECDYQYERDTRIYDNANIWQRTHQL